MEQNLYGQMETENNVKKETTTSIEHLDFEDNFTGDRNTDSMQKIVSDYNSDENVESETDYHNTAMETTCFDKPEPNSFVAIRKIPDLSKSWIDRHQQPLEISRQKNFDDVIQQKLIESGFEEEQYSPDASALTKINFSKNLLLEIHELPERHEVSGYLSVHNSICDSSKRVPRNTIQENNISKQVKMDFQEYYQNLLKGFFERHDLHVETRKSFSFSDYVQKFDDYFSEDYSLSHLDKQGKEDVLKLLNLRVDLVQHTCNRQYGVLPVSINDFQEYFEQMPVSRPSHVETMRNEWARVRSYWLFLSNIKVSAIALARVGFYYTGKCTECKCFSCGKVYKEWQDGDDPYVIHQQISPNCPYMNGQESENVPIHEEDRHHIEQTLVPSTTPVNQAGVAAEAAAVRIPGDFRLYIKLYIVYNE